MIDVKQCSVFIERKGCDINDYIYNKCNTWEDCLYITKANLEKCNFFKIENELDY